MLDNVTIQIQIHAYQNIWPIKIRDAEFNSSTNVQQCNEFVQNMKSKTNHFHLKYLFA